MRPRPFILLLLLLTVHPSWAEETMLSPEYGVAQFAGQIGYLSAGAGRSFHDGVVEADLLFGYAPAWVVGEDVYALALKARYLYSSHYVAGQRLTPYLGLGLNYYHGEQYRIRTSDDYPEKYYTYYAWHLMPHLGLNVTPQDGGTQGVSVYVEAGVLDSYLLDYLNSTEYLSPLDLFSVSLGLRVPLK